MSDSFIVYGSRSEPEILLEKVRKYAEERQLTQTVYALGVMERSHAGQLRKGKKDMPYIIHPLTMAWHAVCMGYGEDELLAACLLHDVIEDCGILEQELEVSETIKSALKLVTFVIPDKMSKADARKLYYEGIYGSTLAMLVKLLDRCNNISTMSSAFSDAKMKEYIAETRLYYPAMLNRLVRDEHYEPFGFLLNYQLSSVISAVERRIDK